MSFFEKGATSTRRFKAAKRGIGFFVGFSLIASVFTLALLPTPYLIERPGPTYNVLGEVSGEPVIDIVDEPSFESNGRLDILTVSILGNRERTPSWLEVMLAWLDGSQKVVPVEAIYPPNRSTEDVQAESSAMMEVSQQDAIAAALTELGYSSPREIYVAEVQSGAAASGKLIAGDFVKSVDGKPLKEIEELRTLVNNWSEKDPLVVEVARSGELISEEISPIKDGEGNYRLGILVGYSYDFPVEVKLQLGDVGGPSGGMMFALGIIDRLTPGDLTGGLHVAGTGTITDLGQVGPIGGALQKMYGAKRAGASVFLVPADNCADVIGKEPQGLTVVKIEKLQDALQSLEKLSENKDLASLPSCTS